MADRLSTVEGTNGARSPMGRAAVGSLPTPPIVVDGAGAERPAAAAGLEEEGTAAACAADASGRPGTQGANEREAVVELGGDADAVVGDDEADAWVSAEAVEAGIGDVAGVGLTPLCAAVGGAEA